MKILIDEEVVKQALDALVKYQTRQSMDDLESAGYAGDDAITALRSALQAERVKPVEITDQLVCEIIDEAGIAFRRHRGSVRGQIITLWDSPESHIVAATIKRCSTAPTPPTDTAKYIDIVSDGGFDPRYIDGTFYWHEPAPFHGLIVIKTR